MTTTPPGRDPDRRDPASHDRDPAYRDDRRDPYDDRPGTTATRRRRGVHQWLALLVGIAYLAVGLVGFAITGFDDPGRIGWWTEHDPGWMLLVFAINPLHNVVHLVIGLLGVLLWATSGGARTYGWLLAIGYGAAFVYGLMVAGDEQLDLLHINPADTWLHLGSALLGLLIALWPRPKSRADDASAVPGSRAY